MPYYHYLSWVASVPGRSVLYFILGLVTVGLTAFVIRPPYGRDQAAPVEPYVAGRFPAVPSAETPIPALISETGVFESLDPLVPIEGFIPYTLNTPFWSDDALKTRWIAIPNDGDHDTPDEQVTFSEEGIWKYPPGTVVVKHFELAVGRETPPTTRRLETRFIVKSEGDDFYSFTYKWNEAGTDAVLLEDGLTEFIPVPTYNGVRFQQWDYPSREQCTFCHRAVSGTILGPSTRQLNGPHYYPSTGRVANQLGTWNFLRLFSATLDENDFDRFVVSSPLASDSSSLQDRALSYLDSNCAYCHRPGSIPGTSFDARLTTPLEQSGLINGLASNTLGISDAALVVPGDTARSLIYQRMRNVGNGAAMPPLAKSLVDSAGLEIMGQWILSLGEPTAIDAPEQLAAEEDLRLSVFPNPFSESATITYRVAGAVPVALSLYDMQGRAVKTIYEGLQPPGRHTKTLDGADVPAGSYLVRLRVGPRSQSFPVVRVK